MINTKKAACLPLISRSARPKSKSSNISLASSPTSPDIDIHLFERKEKIRQIHTSQNKFSRYVGSMSSKDSDSNSSGSPDNASAKLNFFESYKKIGKETERVEFRKMKQSPEIAFLKEIDKGGLSPKPFGLIKSGTPQSRSSKSRSPQSKSPQSKGSVVGSFDLRNIGMGDTYAKAFSKGIKHIPQVEELNLKENRLSEKGALKILSKLVEKKTKYLVLTGNHLGEQSVQKIVEILDNPKSYLKHLSLENTKLSESAIIQLCNSLKENTTLTRLNLAKNEIRNGAVKAIGEMLSKNYGLRYLDLHWNLIRGDEAIYLFNGLEQNRYLRHLDLSWNAIGNSTNLEIINSIGKAFKENTLLIHADLSYNNFNLQECEILGKFLYDNHTLIGLHMLGNDCKINSKGFIIPMKCRKEKDAHNFQRVINEPTFMIHNEESSNCWICERWVEAEFTVKSEKAAFLHLECDGFAGELMENNNNGTFYIKRVVPPGVLKFFYSNENGVIALEDTPSEPYDKPIEVIIGANKKVLETVNVSYAEGIVCDPRNLFETQIRIPGTTYTISKPPPAEPEEIIYERIIWDISISSFKDYKFDTEQRLQANFETDFKHSRINKFVKDPLDVMNSKECLEKVYHQFKETYRHLAALGGNDLFCFGSNIFSDFLTQCNVFDENFGINDLGICWNATKCQRSKCEAVIGNRLSKHEFMEIIARIANDKYVRNNLCKNTAEALQRLFDESLIPIMSQFDTNRWRMEKYCCEEVDLELKVYKPIFDEIFRLYTGKIFCQSKGFMSLDEFRNLCIESGLLNDSREIDFCAYKAIMCHKEEILEKKHVKLSYVEFLEAICRVFDQCGNKNEKLRDKVRAGVTQLINLCSDAIKGSFTIPTDEAYFKLMYRPKL
ncbi:unnamed protein product [Blepharisma stoltei]|uniref:Uncharacterized protein n=1 Tax=Blepharisma stoltei TaxID=1481888 RepID=A0AAU9KM29_9CILI|nr:unnamed protein product [Blepharisma stoltei]